MKNARQTYWLSLVSIRVLSCICALAIADVAIAQSSVQYGIGESARLLRAAIDLENGDITQAEFDTIQMAETCKSPSIRLQNRNRPWMSVWNTSTDPDEITRVTIELNEPGFEFGDGDVAGDGFDGLLSMLSSAQSDAGVTLDSASYGADNTELVLDFSGLDQDTVAIFRFDIDEPGGVEMFPDFREAMLGADTGDGPGARALLTTDFASGEQLLSTFSRAGPLSTSGLTEAYHAQTMSMVEPSEVIPEPTSIVLLLAGLTGIAAMRRYRA